MKKWRDIKATTMLPERVAKVRRDALDRLRNVGLGFEEGPDDVEAPRSDESEDPERWAGPWTNATQMWDPTQLRIGILEIFVEAARAVKDRHRVKSMGLRTYELPVIVNKRHRQEVWRHRARERAVMGPVRRPCRGCGVTFEHPRLAGGQPPRFCTPACCQRFSGRELQRLASASPLRSEASRLAEARCRGTA